VGKKEIDDELAALPLDTGEELGAMPELQLVLSNENEVVAHLTEEVIRTILNSDLKAELEKRGVPHGFPLTATWRQLIQNPIEEQTQPSKMRGPTGPEGGDELKIFTSLVKL
jgi:hypothetical protein